MYDCRILMTPCQIAHYNRQNAARVICGVNDLARAPVCLSREAVLAQQTAFPEENDPRFDGAGHFWGADFYEGLQAVMDFAALGPMVSARFGLVTEQGLLRLFPTNAPSYRQRWVPELDRFAQTLVKVGELVLIWHESSDGLWFFVQTRHVWGWVMAEAVAQCGESAWRYWLKERDFVQVIASRTLFDYEEDGKSFVKQLLMGTRLPFCGYCNHAMAATLPKRDADGCLRTITVLIPDDARFIRGLLPFQEGRIAEQALKMLGEPYGWGGAGTYRDCTSLIDDIFSTFNFHLPRNSTAQRQMTAVERIPADLSLKEREALVHALPKGTVLYLPGHAMLYLGVRDGNMRILHSVFQIGVPMWSEMVTYKCKRVMLGQLRQYRANGETFLASLREYWCPWQIK